MKKVLFLLVVFIFTGCNNIANIPSPIPKIDTSKMKNIFGSNVKKDYFTGGKLRSEFIMSDKSAQNGLLKKYGYNGKLNSTVNIENGVKHGTETLFDQSGRVLKKTPYVQGRKQGVLAAFYPNGQTMATITYVNNVKHGKAVKYNTDGSINQQVTFKNGNIAN